MRKIYGKENTFRGILCKIIPICPKIPQNYKEKLFKFRINSLCLFCRKKSMPVPKHYFVPSGSCSSSWLYCCCQLLLLPDCICNLSFPIGLLFRSTCLSYFLLFEVYFLQSKKPVKNLTHNCLYFNNIILSFI